MSARVEERRMATSVLVIGTGAAGLRVAIELAERGVQVLCVGKRRRDDAHTVLASGGVNAALGTMDPEDSWEQHAADTLREGYWLSDPRSVELLARDAPRAIDDLVRWGVRFARTSRKAFELVQPELARSVVRQLLADLRRRGRFAELRQRSLLALDPVQPRREESRPPRLDDTRAWSRQFAER